MKLRLTVILSLLIVVLHSQNIIPTKCLEIESILVDACVPGGGCSNASSPACNCEGKNEMVRFRVGQNAISISDISVQWPNNTFRGFVQNATTASLVTQLNSTIQTCGYLVEPPGGLIPSGAQVLLITSTDMCITANSFASLTDTLYTIFQDAGNFQGHFANTNNTTTQTTTPTGAPSFRTLIMTQVSTNCSDTAVYDRALLVNTNGLYGGSTALNDGSTVEFSWPGNPIATYVNRGCSAPFTPLTIATMNPASICNADTVLLFGVISGNATSSGWYGGTGNWQNPLNDTAGYVPGNNENGTIELYFFAVSACGDTITDTLQLTINPLPSVQIALSGPDTLCNGDTLILQGSGATSYVWSTGATSSGITIIQPGTYFVIGSNTCGVDTTAVAILSSPSPNVSISPSGPQTICAGDSITLIVSGGDNYIWNTGSTSDSITVPAGTYTVIGSNYCGSQSVSTIINSLPFPQVIVSPTSASICVGDSIQLTATGALNYSWSNNDTGSTTFVNMPGIYFVTGSNICGSDTASVVITADSIVTAQITPAGPSVLCTGDSITLNALGGNSYLWSTASNSQNITVTQPGTYYVVVSAACGTDTAYTTINAAAVPNVLLSPSGPIDLCAGDSVTLLATGASSYSWSNSINTSSNIITAPGTYWVIGANQCGTDTASITVNGLNHPSVSITGQDTICQGQSAVLIANGATNYIWNTGSQDSTITVNSTGQYYVIGTNVCGADTTSFVISNSMINAVIVASDTSGLAPFTVTLTGLSSSAITWQWSLGTNGSSSDSITTQVYSSIGPHDIILVVSNSQGCLDTAYLTIYVLAPEVIIELQNVFTPNDDQMNDVFLPNIIGAAGYDMQIYDRWGALMYSGDGSQGGWNGKHINGENATSGTYWFLLNIKLYSGEQITKQGFLTLLR